MCYFLEKSNDSIMSFKAYSTNMFLQDTFFKQHILLNDVLFSTTYFVIQYIWLIQRICSTTCRTVQLCLPAVRELFWGMWGRGAGGWRGICVSGSGYNEVLALGVRNMV